MTKKTAAWCIIALIVVACVPSLLRVLEMGFEWLDTVFPSPPAKETTIDGAVTSITTFMIIFWVMLSSDIGDAKREARDARRAVDALSRELQHLERKIERAFCQLEDKIDPPVFVAPTKLQRGFADLFKENPGK